jgi:aminopeptidase N
MLAALLAAAFVAQPGAAGIGDPLFPRLGNGGYDALHYDLTLRYATRAPAQRVRGRVRMIARATQALSRFDLDFAGDSAGAVTVDGARAAVRRSRQDLVITPARALTAGQRFTVRVAFISHTRRTTRADDWDPFGWFTTRDGSVTAGQPSSAHVIYPVDDHPSDMASYAFRIDVPAGVTAVANGERTGRRTAHGRTVWSYRLRAPMASELVQIAVGRLAVIDRGTVDGVHVRDVVARRVEKRSAAALARTPAHLRWLEQRLGAFPFPTYGVLAADRPFGYALESETLSLFPALLLRLPRSVYEPIMVHELAHQWFGDSVAPVRWRDVWLNEGHATWYEREYGRQFFGQSMLGYLKDAYKRGDRLRARYGPVARPAGHGFATLFNDNVYSGGALVLYALQQTVGDPVFRAIERGWVTTFRGRSMGTGDFIAYASRVAGRDLGPFLRAWLYGRRIPPMPGHPGWKAEPAG